MKLAPHIGDTFYTPSGVKGGRTQDKVVLNIICTCIFNADLALLLQVGQIYAQPNTVSDVFKAIKLALTQ